MPERRKKLIEVALPLEAINKESAREKSIRHGHPSTLHLWWARRPLAACRAVLFAQLVDDPDSDPAYRNADGSVDEDRAGLKRAQLFNLIEELVRWENSNNDRVINAARAEIARCVASRLIEEGKLQKETIIHGKDEGKPHPKGPLSGEFRTAWELIVHGHGDLEALADRTARLCPPEVVNHFLATYAPPVLDPFAGGGSIPLEAQRLGLRAYASDLNPVAVLINKALIEIPPRFAGLPPVNPEAQRKLRTAQYRGAQGLAEDVRYYGKWMRDEAEKRIGHLYPKVKITTEMAKDRPDLKDYVGHELTVIAWLWARTVPSPDPSMAGKHVPLVRSFWLSTKKGKEAYVHPVIDKASGGYHFTVRTGKPKSEFDPDDGTIRRAGGRCLVTGSTMGFPHVRQEGQAGRMKTRLMAIVAEGTRARVYLDPLTVHADVAAQAKPTWSPTAELPHNPRDFKTPNYGMKTFADLFTERQLAALTTFSDLVGEARAKVLADAMGARASRPHVPIHDRGYLPHWEVGERPQFITFRLADSLPRQVAERLAEEGHLGARASCPHDDENAAETAALRKDQARQAVDEALDAGHGTCHLQDHRIAELVENALLHFDGTRYKLHAWTIMPNHVHVLVTPLHDNSLSAIMHSWKSFTAKEANNLLERIGAFWQEEYFDRMIRDESHWHATLDYIEYNPVKAGLCQRPEQWAYGSACRGEQKRSGRPRSQDDRPLPDGGTGPQAYADAVATYLAFSLSKAADYWSSLCSWHSSKELVRNTFGRQALPMVWDYAEPNPFQHGTGGFGSEWSAKVLDQLRADAGGSAKQLDATAALNGIDAPAISTDPPYYDNIGYADLSDYFYIWLRGSLRTVFPQVLSTMLTPKAEEMIASPYRHDGSKAKAAKFFEEGLGRAIGHWRAKGCPECPTTIFYAFKQAETDTAGTASTGWETFLDGVIEHGFSITGTWPMRTEMGNRMVGSGTNALASSVVLACVPREADAPMATRRELLSSLKRELPDAMKKLQSGNIAPVDLAQAAIGPGMAVFSRYSKVVESDGEAMTVRTALTLINQILDEVLAEQEGEFDGDTRWAVAWFEQHGVQEGPYGVAETLSKAKNTSVQGLVDAGVITARGGKVKLIAREDMPDDWDPITDARATCWEATQHLIRRLQHDGEQAAADLLARLGGDYGDRARDLAYRLYSICERKSWAHEARAYNSLVIAWSEISKLSRSVGEAKPAPTPSLFE